MCLAVPMKVIEIEGTMAQVEESGVRRSARIDLVEAKVGDYVIVHAGIAIDRLEPEEAAETLKLFAELFPSEMGAVEADGATGGAEKS